MTQFGQLVSPLSPGLGTPYHVSGPLTKLAKCLKQCDRLVLGQGMGQKAPLTLERVCLYRDPFCYVGPFREVWREQEWQNVCPLGHFLRFYLKSSLCPIASIREKDKAASLRGLAGR